MTTTTNCFRWHKIDTPIIRKNDCCTTHASAFLEKSVDAGCVYISKSSEKNHFGFWGTVDAVFFLAFFLLLAFLSLT